MEDFAGLKDVAGPVDTSQPQQAEAYSDKKITQSRQYQCVSNDGGVLLC